MSATVGEGIQAMNILLKAGTNVNYQDDSGCSALLQAVCKASVKCVDMLVKAGANVNITDRHFRLTPIARIPYWCDDPRCGYH